MSDTNISEALAAYIFMVNVSKKDLRNVGILPHHYTASQLRRS